MEPINNPVANNGKTVAIVSYITLVGWIVALILHNNNKTRLGAYHLRQMLGLMLIFLLLGISRYILFLLPGGWIVLMILRVGLLVLWIFGLVAAVNGEEKPTPLVGDLFQKWFAGLGI